MHIETRWAWKHSGVGVEGKEGRLLEDVTVRILTVEEVATPEGRVKQTTVAS